MNASELIVLLQAAIAEHGDLEVVCDADYSYFDTESVEVGSIIKYEDGKKLVAPAFLLN